MVVTVMDGGTNARLDVAVTVPGVVFGEVEELPQAMSADTIAARASLRAVALSIVVLTKKGDA